MEIRLEVRALGERRDMGIIERAFFRGVDQLASSRGVADQPIRPGEVGHRRDVRVHAKAESGSTIAFRVMHLQGVVEQRPASGKFALIETCQAQGAQRDTRFQGWPASFRLAQEGFGNSAGPSQVAAQQTRPPLPVISFKLRSSIASTRREILGARERSSRLRGGVALTPDQGLAVTRL